MAVALVLGGVQTSVIVGPSVPIGGMGGGGGRRSESAGCELKARSWHFKFHVFVLAALTTFVQDSATVEPTVIWALPNRRLPPL